MTVSAGPNLGKMINAATGDPFDIEFRSFLRMIDALLHGSVISRALSAPPGSPTNGDRYIIGGSPSGAWAGAAGQITCWTMDDPAQPSGHWDLYPPKTGWIVYSVADASFYSWSGSAWVAFSAGGSSTLAGDTDVAISGPANADVLTYDSTLSKWKNAAGGGLGGSSTLAGDTDVAISSPANADVLTYDSTSSKWKNAAGGGGGGGGNVNADTHPGSPTAYDDEFEEGSLSSQWTAVGTAPTPSLSKGSLLFTDTPGTTHFGALQEAAPSAPWTFACKLNVAAMGYGKAGLFISNDAGGGNESTLWGLNPQGPPGSGLYLLAYRYLYYSSAYNNDGNANSRSAGAFTGYPQYFAINNDGTNLNYLFSYDGIAWFLSYTETLASFMVAVTKIGVGMDAQGNGNPFIAAFDWFRRIA